MEIHTEGMVRVAHPGHGMGVEFPSRTLEQRAQVGNLIGFLRSCPETMLELNVSPRALTADLSQFEPARGPADQGPVDQASADQPSEDDDLEDPLLDLLRRGTSLQQDEFLDELRRQRLGESVAT